MIPVDDSPPPVDVVGALGKWSAGVLALIGYSAACLAMLWWQVGLAIVMLVMAAMCYAARRYL